MPLSTLKSIASKEEYRDSKQEILDRDEPDRKVQILIIDEKYYAVIKNRTAYMSITNLSKEQIRQGVCREINWKGDLNDHLFSFEKRECIPGSVGYGWDYNYCGVRTDCPDIVPLKYIYRNILHCITGRDL
jgi:hypothetical protein